MSSDISQAFLSPSQPLPPSIPPPLPRPPNDAGGDEDGQYRPPFRLQRSREAVDNFGSSSDSDTPQPPAARHQAKAEALPQRASSNVRGQQQTTGGLKFTIADSRWPAQKQTAAAGPVLMVLDPRCNWSDLELVLWVRKAELQVPTRTRLRVVAAAAPLALHKLWNKHRARVIDPEQIIQGIVRCALQF